MQPEDTEQLVRLISSHQEQLYRYVFSLMPNEHDAKDVVQETCVALCRKFGEYDTTRPFLPWAFRFAYLEVLKLREKKQRSALSLSGDVIEVLAQERCEQRQTLDARLAALEQCLAELPKADFELIRGRYHSPISIEELATQAAMSQRTLYRSLDRVRRMLFNCITGRLAGEGIG